MHNLKNNKLKSQRMWLNNTAILNYTFRNGSHSFKVLSSFWIAQHREVIINSFTCLTAPRVTNVYFIVAMWLTLNTTFVASVNHEITFLDHHTPTLTKISTLTSFKALVVLDTTAIIEKISIAAFATRFNKNCSSENYNIYTSVF